MEKGGIDGSERGWRRRSQPGSGRQEKELQNTDTRAEPAPAGTRRQPRVFQVQPVPVNVVDKQSVGQGQDVDTGRKRGDEIEEVWVSP